MNKTLLPCPFCGGEVEIDMLDSAASRNVKIYSAVHCPECHQWFFKGLSKEKTVAAWNRRVDARQLALKTRVCPMCEDCPDGCPVETPKDSRNIVTNADRIRSMSDEELAREMLFFVPSDFNIKHNYNRHYTGIAGGYYVTADEAIQANFDWLKQPVKEE
jgi:hypothetical protein